MRRITVLLAAFAVAPFGSVTAQYSLQAKPGDRVRVRQCHTWIADGRTHTSCRKDTGIFAASPADSIVLEVDGHGRRLAIPVASLRKFEVNRGGKSNAETGMTLGGFLLGGLGFMAGFTATTTSCPPGTRCIRPSTADVLRVTAIAASVGAGIGAVIGSTIHGDRWEEVPLDRLRVSVAPQRDGSFALAVSIRF